MTETKDEERLSRLVAVETKLDIVIKNQDDERKSREDLRRQIDNLLPTLVTQSQLAEKIGYLEKELEANKTSKFKNVVIQVLITAPIAALIGFFFATIRQ
jgi:hypothetical protein